MLNLTAEIRKEAGKNTDKLRKEGKLPAVLYGYKAKNLPLQLDYREFEKVYEEAGESSLISLEVEGEKKPFQVLIYDFQKDPLSGQFTHVDLYQPSLKKKIETNVPLVFEGEPGAVKNLDGTLVKNISEVEVRSLPHNLPHELKVNVEKLETFEDHVKISDLVLPEGVEVLKDPEEIIALVVPPTKVEEELEKPIEEKIEEVEKVEEKKEEEEGEPEEKKEEK